MRVPRARMSKWLGKISMKMFFLGVISKSEKKKMLWNKAQESRRPWLRVRAV